jgi:hypothetical protein
MKSPVAWLLALLGFIALFSGCSVRHDLSDSEKSVLMTEKYFANYSEKAGKSITGKFKKTYNYLNSSSQLEYQNDPKTAVFFVYSIVALEDSVGKAVTMEVSYRTGVTVGFKYSGVEEEPIKLTGKIGQHVSLSLLKYQGKPAGNLLTTVIDNKTVLLMFTGIYFDNEDSFQEFIEPYLSRVIEFKPDKN